MVIYKYVFFVCTPQFSSPYLFLLYFVQSLAGYQVCYWNMVTVWTECGYVRLLLSKSFCLFAVISRYF